MNKQICTCVASCRGKAGLGDGWICALEAPLGRDTSLEGQLSFARDYLIAWLIRGKYRTLSHRHNGSYSAKDEAYDVEWNAADTVTLVRIMTAPPAFPA